MNGSYVSLAGLRGTAPFAIPALFLALSGGPPAISVDQASSSGQLGWRTAASSQTVQTKRFSPGAVKAFVPKTAMGKSLHELRKKILQAGGARPASSLLAEIREQRGEI